MGRRLHTVLVRALLRHAGVGSPCGRDPRGSRSSRTSPPRVAVPSGGGGRPLDSGGAEGRSCGSQAGGGCGGGGAPPRPPALSGVGLPSVVSGVPPRGILAPCGLPGGRGRWARSGWPPTGQCGEGGGGGGGGEPPALVRAPVFPGPASDKSALFAPSWAPPVRRRPAASRVCGRLPRPWCPRTPGAGASSGGVRGRRFFGLPPSALGPEWEGGGGVGGPLVPWRRLLMAGGGRHGGPGPGGKPSARGSHPSPAPLYLEPDPRAGPRWGLSSPRPSSRGAGRPVAAVRVSGQRLAGCGAAGSPPRSLSPPSLPREVARAPSSRRTVGGAWVGGPSPPPPSSRVRRLRRHLRRRLCGGWGCGGGGLRRR